ncbi:hypothetical protein D3C81_2114850 [compost metagenome]
MADRFGHGIDVARGAGDRLGDHLASAVEDPCGEVAGLPDTGTEGGADQRQRLFFDHRNQAVPHDLQVHIGKLEACHVGTPSSLLGAK